MFNCRGPPNENIHFCFGARQMKIYISVPGPAKWKYTFLFLIFSWNWMLIKQCKLNFCFLFDKPCLFRLHFWIDYETPCIWVHCVRDWTILIYQVSVANHVTCRTFFGHLRGFFIEYRIGHTNIVFYISVFIGLSILLNL